MQGYPGFEYALLANNLDCALCHTIVDSAQRYYNFEPDLYGGFDRAKVGALSTLQVSKDFLGSSPSVIDDFDADSYIAGTLHVRGAGLDYAGKPIDFWRALSLWFFPLDAHGHLAQNAFGELIPSKFNPASGSPAPRGESLYLDYPEDPSDMPDGLLPLSIPGPFPDDGGIDPVTGNRITLGAGNRVVDDGEFWAVALLAEGAISGGLLTVVPEGQVIDSPDQISQALLEGTTDSLVQSVDGNVILVGTHQDRIYIDGTVAIDGDAILAGLVKGEGQLVVRGNIYLPGNLEYADEYFDSSVIDQRKFGIGSNGAPNLLGLAAGGNVLIGNFLRPATLQPDWSVQPPSIYALVSGSPSPDGAAVGEWAFALAEIARFNRYEWAATQPFLPGPGEADLDPSQWTTPNSKYIEGHLPRYYGFGPGDEIPIHKNGDLYWNPQSEAWISTGFDKILLDWNSDSLTLADPDDPQDPTLGGAATVALLTPTGGWIKDELYALTLNYFRSLHRFGEPLAIDALVTTGNAVIAVTHRDTPTKGRLRVNGAVVAADVGLLVPGRSGQIQSELPKSDFDAGLRLNYDERVTTLFDWIR